MVPFQTYPREKFGDGVLKGIIMVAGGEPADTAQYCECSAEQFPDSGVDSIEIYRGRYNGQACCVLRRNSDRKLPDTKLVSRSNTAAMFSPSI